MISLIKGLDNKRYNPFVFVYANTDNKSIQRVKDANVMKSGNVICRCHSSTPAVSFQEAEKLVNHIFLLFFLQ